jgi:N-acetylneuraminic acid mutarotase
VAAAKHRTTRSLSNARPLPLVEAVEGRQLFAAVLGASDTEWATGATASSALSPAIVMDAVPTAPSMNLLGAEGEDTVAPPAFEPISLSGWSSSASAPSVRGDAAVATVDGMVYVFGGLRDDSLVPKTRSIDVYDPATNKWQSGVGETPVAFSHVATAVDGDDVYIAGGILGNGRRRIEATNDVWKYDVSDNTWSELPELPSSRAAGSMVLLDGKLHFLGGSGGDPEKESAAHFVLDLNDLSAGWSTSTSMPGGRKRFGAAVAFGKIYVIGGHTGEDRRKLRSEVWCWDPADPDSWRTRASLPSARSHMPQSLLADPWGGILSVGGKTNSASASKDVLRYDPVRNRWTTLRSLPSGRNSALAALVGDTLVFTTGSSGGNNFRRETWRATVRV